MSVVYKIPYLQTQFETSRGSKTADLFRFHVKRYVHRAADPDPAVFLNVDPDPHLDPDPALRNCDVTGTRYLKLEEKKRNRLGFCSHFAWTFFG